MCLKLIARTFKLYIIPAFDFDLNFDMHTYFDLFIRISIPRVFTYEMGCEEEI